MRAQRFRVPDEGETYEWPLAETTEERFWAKVERRGPTDCWPWTAFCNTSGYGMLRNGRRMALAPRVAWVIEHGPVPEGLHVLHDCDNRRCVNVAHLRPGTNADNVADKVRRGRHLLNRPDRHGERHPMARLKEADVLAIRESSANGRDLARQYEVDESTICAVRARRIWRHL